DPERRGKRRMVCERLPQPFEIPCPERHGSASRGAVRGVGEANQRLAAGAFEELDDRRESLVARALLDDELVDELCLSPRCLGLLCHEAQPTVGIETGGSRLCAESVTPTDGQTRLP